MKLRNILALALFATAFTACETVDEDERFIGPVEFTPKKNVLIEDFTGQLCVNCPKAAQTTHMLQKAYGNEHIIPVAIHPSTKAMPNLGSPQLSSPVSDAYVTLWNVPNLPNGLVDRTEGLSLYKTWSAQAVKRMQKEALADITINSCNIDDDKNITINVDVLGKIDVEASLQLWLTEDSIKGLQKTESGMDREYIHNHVLRDTINALYGEPITLQANQILSKNYTYTVKNEKWNTKNLDIIAFVFNDKEGVMQVVKKKITTLK